MALFTLTPPDQAIHAEYTVTTKYRLIHLDAGFWHRLMYRYMPLRADRQLMQYLYKNYKINRHQVKTIQRRVRPPF